MHLIQHHQIVLMLREVEGRVREFLPIQRRFQVQTDALSQIRNRVGNGSLTDLARTEQRYGWHMAQAVPDKGFDAVGVSSSLQLWHVVPDLQG